MTRPDQQALLARLHADGLSAVERLDHWAAVSGPQPFLYDGAAERWHDFRAFGAASDAVAGYLAARGIGAGDHVALYMRAPLAMAQAMFGIWKIGAVYVPLNFAYEGHLLAYQLNDAGPRLVVTEPRLAGALAQVLPGCPSVERIALALAEGEEDAAPAAALAAHRPVDPWPAVLASPPAPRAVVAPGDPACIIYTSGTTGPSKGVVLPHRWMAQYTYLLRIILTRDDVLYNDLPLHHVGGAIGNLVRAAWIGCRVACWERFSPTDFWRRIAVSGATSAILLDTMIAWLGNAPPATGDRMNGLNKVHMQPLPQAHQAIASRFGFDLVTAGFGQTECGALMYVYIDEVPYGEGTPPALYRGLGPEERARRLAAHGLSAHVPADSPKGLMGHPSPFLEAAVLDADDMVCADGAVGQLAVRPRLPSLMLREYLGKPEVTAAAFANLWFHTGDAAIRREDGIFLFVDRMGDRIRVRGENVSSYEVEELIGRHEAVALCAAVAVPAAEGDEDDIACFVVPTEGAAADPAVLADWASRIMPRHMRPRHWRFVDELPRTASNKIEKYKLRRALLAEPDQGGTT